MPLPLTRLVGREDDQAAVIDLLSRCRLLTVSGPGGVGKTRLALAVASELADAYRDGAWLSDLTEVGHRAELWASLGAALGLAPGGGNDLGQSVIAHLRSRQLLLVLDGCEHLLPEWGDVALSVARACPDVSLLLTSRQSLGVEGERVWPLAGLVVDAPAHDHRDAPAVRLFIERAEAQRPDFALTPDESLVVADLCGRLDGMPLAIELAAGLVGVLSLNEILGRLDDPLALLVGGSATIPVRHRSLLASLERDHGLLSGDDAILFRRLAVFAGGFTLAAADAVCAFPPLADGGVLELLASLVKKSLVAADTAGDQTRYRLLEATRAFAASRLAESREAECIRERHALWVMALAREAEPNIRGSEPETWLGRLAADSANVEAALEWTVLAERTDCTLGIAAAMAACWQKSGDLSTGAKWLAQALAMPGQRAGLRVEALLGQARLLGRPATRPARWAHWRKPCSWRRSVATWATKPELSISLAHTASFSTCRPLHWPRSSAAQRRLAR